MSKGEDSITTSELLVNSLVGVKAILDGLLILGVEDDLVLLGTVSLDADALTSDLNGVDHVVKDGVVDGSEGARLRALLGGSAVEARSGGEDAALSDNDDLLLGKLLLELTDQLSLDATEVLGQTEGDEDHDNLLGRENDLLNRRDVQIVQLILPLNLRVVLDVQDVLGDLLLELGGLSSLLLANLHDHPLYSFQRQISSRIAHN